MGKLTAIKTKSIFQSLLNNSEISEQAIHFILDTGLIYTHGIYINGAAYGTEANGAINLSIAGVTKALSLSTHTHSNYLEKNSNIDIGSYIIKSGNNELLKWASNKLILGSPTYITGTAHTTRNSTNYDILDTGNFSVVAKTSTNISLQNVATIKYGSSAFLIDYVKRINGAYTFDNITYTSVGTTNVNNQQYGIITMYTDGSTPASYALIRADIPNGKLEYRTSGSTTWKTIVTGALPTVFVGSGNNHASGLVPDPGATAGTAKFLCEDGTWKTPTYTSDTNTWRNILVNGTLKLSTAINSGGLDIINGTNTTVEWTSGNKLKINSVNTWTAFVGASADSAGTAGYVSAPGKGNQGKYLRGDGTWATPTNTWNAANTSQAGYIPKLATGGGTIATQASEYVLVYVSSASGTVTPTWKLLPANAFKNDNTWKAANASQEGYVPKSTANKILRTNGDGALYWGDDANTTYTFYNLLFQNSGGTTVDTYKPTTSPTKTLKAGANVTISAASNVITIASTNTWNANAVGVAGYVAAPTKAANANMTWLTNAEGVPAWRASNNHTHSYLPLSGGTLNSGSMIVWRDWGQWEAENPTYPKANGGLQWSGTSDTIKLFAEETASDDLRLVLLFGDDATPRFEIRDKNGNANAYITNGGAANFTALTVNNTAVSLSGHKHAYTDLTGSGTTANQVIVSNGTANGWTLKTLGSRAFDSTSYLPLSGGIMTGIETISATSAINLRNRTSNGTRASYYTSDNYIHGGEDRADQDGANIQIGTWYGFGIYPTISGQTRTQGKNSFWHNARTGNTYTWGEFYSYDGSTNRKVLHEGNSSVSLSGSTLSVKINGTTQSLTNTWRGMLNNLTTSNSSTSDSLSAYLGYLLANGSARDNTKLPLSGGTMVGTISAANDAYGGGGFNNGYANIILRGNTTTGTSGIVFSSSKGDTSINRPSDCAFIQFLPYGVSAATAVGTNPTINTSGESGRFVIGIHNDPGDLLWLQTSAVNDLKHVVGANVYTIYDSGNLPAYPTKASWNYDDRYVSSVALSGNYLRISKNGANTDLTIPYATVADHLSDFYKTSRVSKNSNNEEIETSNGWYTSLKFIQISGFCPPTMYRTTGDMPAPYGIGFGNGSESGGIMPIGLGDKLEEIRFYGANSGPTIFTFGRQLWEDASYDSRKSNRYTTYLSINSTNGNLTTSGTVTAPTFVGNLSGSASALGTYAESAFLRHRNTTSTNQEGTLWSQIGIKQYNNALPDGLNNTYNYGEVISFATTNARFDIYASHTSSESQGLYYRSGWGNDKKSWLHILDSYNSSVSKSGETLTVKINGTTLSLTNTWRGILNNLTSDSTTDSLSAAQGKALNNKFGSYLPLSGGTLTGNLSFSNSGTGFRGINYGTMGDNDQWRIGGAATGSNAGYMEIATADDGNEPIYVRQYMGVFSTLIRTLTLLDASGNTSFPGTVSATTFNGTATGNVTALSINGNYLRWTKNGTNTDLTIPYATNASLASTAHRLEVYTETSDNTNRYRIIGLQTLNAGWVNKGLVLAVASRHSGVGIYTIHYGAEISNGYYATNNLSGTDTYYTFDRCYCKIRYFGDTSDVNLDKIICHVKPAAGDKPTSAVFTFFLHSYDGSSPRISILQDWNSPFTLITNGATMASVDTSVYGNLKEVTVMNESNSCTGNAATATKWQTTRTLTIGNTGKSVDGSGNVSWSLAEIGAAAASHTHSYLPLSGGTLTGGLSFTRDNVTKISLRADSEGGNLRLYSPDSYTGGDGNNRYWEMDAFNGNLRFYTTGENSTYPNFNIDTNGAAHSSAQGKLWGEKNDGADSGLDADLLDGLHLNRIVGTYTREQIGKSPNFDNPSIRNGLFEMRTSSETTGETGTKPWNGFAPFLTLRVQNVMMQLCGTNNNGWFIRGKQSANVTMENTAWQQLARITDNVASASKLANARTLWGQNFDGTANVNGNMTGVGTITASGDNIITKNSTDQTRFAVKNNNGQVELLTGAARGVYDRTNDTWIVATNGTNTFLQRGNVGIGTTSPIEKLDVNGNIISKNIRIWGNEVSNNSKGLFIQASDKSNRAYITYNGNVANTDYLNICSVNGNIILSPAQKVGISTTSPAYKLHVNGSINGTSIYLNGTALSTASTHAHGDYVTAIGTSGNTLTWSKGGTAQTAITIPYATEAWNLHAVASINGSNTATYPWRRIARTGDITGNCNDRDAIILIKGNYNGAPHGIIKISLRTDNLADGAYASAGARWLVRGNINVDDLKIAIYKVKGKAYADVYYKVVGGWPRMTLHVIRNNGWTFFSSNEETNSTNPTNAYKSVEEAATAIYGVAYTSIDNSFDTGVVNYANSAGAVAWGNVTSKPAATGGATTPVYWNGSGFTNCTAYASASVNYANSAGSVAWGNVTGKPDTFTPSTHNHNGSYSYAHQTTFAFNEKHDSNYVTFDLNNPAGAPDSAWYNGFVTTHSGYLSSYIINGHRSANWYVGYSENSTAPTWYKLIHSGNIGSLTVQEAKRPHSRGTVYNVNTVTDGIIYNYSSTSGWLNAPSGMSYGSVLTINPSYWSGLNYLGLQLAWDVNHGSSTNPGKLWFRTSNEGAPAANNYWVSGWSQVITSAGGLTINGSLTASSFYNTSDIRTKKDISNISEHVRKFKFKKDNSLHYGFIALELEVEHPELVDNLGEYKTVDYNSALSLLLAKAENKIKELENRIKVLENAKNS